MNPHYATTVFRASDPSGGWPRSFAIITAWNPMGERLRREENEVLNLRLAGVLTTVAPWYWPVTGGSPGFDHAEPGLAADLPLSEALEMGRQLKQEAIFWVV